MLPHAGHLPQLVLGGVQHPRQGAKAIDEVMGQAVHIPLGDGVKQQQLQHPVVRPALQTPGAKLVLDPLPVSAVEMFGLFRHRRSPFPKRAQPYPDLAEPLALVQAD